MPTTYIIYGDYDISLSYSVAALRIFREENNETGEAKTLNNIAIIYDLWDDTSHAIMYYNKAIEIFRRHDMKEDIIIAKHNIALIFNKNEKYDEAIFLLQEIIDNSKFRQFC